MARADESSRLRYLHDRQVAYRGKAEKSFDVVRHVRPGMPPTVPSSYNRPVEGQPDKWSASDESLGGFWQGGQHWTEVAADDAIDYIGLAQGKPNPFFMYIAFNAPHDPRQAPLAFQEIIRSIVSPCHPTTWTSIPTKTQLVVARIYAMRSWAHFPRTAHAVRTHRREYYAAISHLDQQIGRILDALERSGKADNTWIIFTADHGLAVGHHGLFRQAKHVRTQSAGTIYHRRPPASPHWNPSPIYCRTRWLLRSSWPLSPDPSRAS